MSHQLAQLNVATMRAGLESPLMDGFVANLERVNALAEQSPGFVWRLKDEDGDATAIRPLGENILVNMSVWQDIASLHSFAFRSAHADILRRRNEWFERMAEAYAVLWWIPSGHRPTVEEAAARLAHLRTHGPTAHAFTFRDAFPPPDELPAYEISSDRARLDVDAIHAFLATSYWSPGIPRATVARAIENSVCLGVFHGGRQVGFARVVTDKATFGYLADVYILEEHRGHGLSCRLLEQVIAHPDLQGLRRVLLATRDAHGLYARFGFKALAAPDRMMEIHDPNAYVAR